MLTLDRRFVAANLAAPGVSAAAFTQAGPMPGQPVAGQTTGLARLTASGTLDIDSAIESEDTIEVITLRGGNPGTACVGWRYVGDPLWRGHDPPTTIAQFEWIDYSTVAGAWVEPHVVSRSDGYVFAAVQASNRYVKVWARPRSGAWTQATVFDAGSGLYTGGVKAAACLVVLPSDRLLCLFWKPNSAGSAIHASYSDDDGATWTTPQLTEEVLGALSINPVRIRAAYQNGQVLMLVHIAAADDDIAQFASVDNGCSFTLIGAIDGWSDVGYPDVVAAGGQFVVCAIDTNTATTGAAVAPWCFRIGSAYTPLSGVTAILATTDAATMEWGTVPAALLTAGELALCADEFGALWLYGSDFDAAGGALREIKATVSYDGGATWALAASGTPWNGGDVVTHPSELTVCGQGGRVLMVSGFGGDGAGDNPLAAHWLGGSTALTMPQGYAGFATVSRARGWTVTYTPRDLPENTGATWTETYTATPTVTLTGLGLRVQHDNVADAASWAATPATSQSQGLGELIEIRAVSGSAYSTIRIGAAGPSSYEVRWEVTPTQIVLRDMVAGANITTLISTVGATGVQLRLALGEDSGAPGNNGKVKAWYRAVDTDADREWIAFGSGSTTLNQGATTTDSVEFGTRTGDATLDVYFRIVCYAQGTDTGVGLYNGQSNPAVILGQPWQGTPAPLAETGVRVAMLAGPTVLGEEWTIPPAYQHPISRIDPILSPSPAAQWWSTAEENSSIVYDLTDLQTSESPFYGVYVDGCNWSTATWEGWNGAAWVAIGTVDLQIGSSLRFTRSGPVIACDPSGGSDVADHIDRDALVGCYWKMGAGGIFRKIASNTGGRWSTTATAGTIQRPVIVLDEYDAGDAASGSGGAILSPRGCLIVRGSTAEYSRYRLYIAAQDTSEGYYTVGTLMVGPLTLLGNYDYGRGVGIQTNVETVVARNGSRKKTRLGTPSRFAVVGWTDGVETSNVHDTSPDYILSHTGGQVVGTPAQVAGDVLGLVYGQDAVPVVYLPRVTVPGSASTSMITARDLLLYGDIQTDTIQLDTVVGDEHVGAGAGELVRVGSVRIDECV